MDLEEKAQLKAKAEVLKNSGNEALKNGKFNEAIAMYTAAIELLPTAVYYANRAQAMIKMEAYGRAIQDADEAIKLDPLYPKSYFRRGTAYYAIGNLVKARNSFQKVLQLLPNDLDAKRKTKECINSINAAKFASAIEVDIPVITPEDISNIVVENSYSGPVFEYGEDGKLSITMEDVEAAVEYMKGQGLIHRKYVLMALKAAIDHFDNEPNMLTVSLPRDDKGEVCGTVTVCGDVHGQYYDLLNIFSLGGTPSDTNRYLFNGDFVDRGSFSFEVVFALLLYKLACPTCMYLHRGNHETKAMNSVYGFAAEVEHKYNKDMMTHFETLFRYLPLASTIENQVFVVHGGLSTEEGTPTLEDIQRLNRKIEPNGGLMRDLLWADPQENPGKAPSERGVGYSFGPEFTKSFLESNNLKLIIRSHQVRDGGYDVLHDGTCITVFSAPKYCDQMDNKGAFIRFHDTKMEPKFTVFDAVPHPNIPAMHYVKNRYMYA